MIPIPFVIAMAVAIIYHNILAACSVKKLKLSLVFAASHIGISLEKNFKGSYDNVIQSKRPPHA
jgi:hypothetical protein